MSSVNSSGAGTRMKQGSKAANNKKLNSDSDFKDQKSNATPRNELKSSGGLSSSQHSASSSLKSSVKRLFSPSNSSKSQQVVNASSISGPPMAKGMSSKKALVMPKSSSATDKGITSSFSSKSISSTSSQNAQVNTNHSIDSSSSYNNLTQESMTGSISSKTFITTSKILECPTSNNSFVTTGSISRSFTNTSNMQTLPETSLSNSSSITDSSLSSLSIRVIDKNELASKKGNSQVKKESKPVKKVTTSAKQTNTSEKVTARNNTAGGTLKKHLNILKSNSKKVLLGSSAPSATISSNSTSTRSQLTNSTKAKTSATKQSSTVNNTSPRSNLSASLISSPGSTNSKSSLAKNNSQNKLPERKASSSKQIEYNTKMQELTNEIIASHQQTTDSKTTIDQLHKEIERLNALYNCELNNKSVDDEKLLTLKQVAEEKQIESAAIKFEYRKIQEIKENLSAENNLLKSFLNSINLNPSNLPSPASLSCKLVKKVSSAQSSPNSSFHSPRQNLNISASTNLASNSPNFNCKF